MKAFVLVIASIFFAPVVNAQSFLASAAQKKIKILSWNIYMLPGIAAHRNLGRAEAIGQLLAASDYDVIVFQEAFNHQARKRIEQLLQARFPFQAGPANQKSWSLKANSGVWIFSKYEVKESQAIIFNARAGIDAMSRKGALLIEIKVDNQSIQIVGTHLQNGKGELQNLQCAELHSKLLEKYRRPGVPQIICGDFNISRYENIDQYEMMLRLLDADDGELKGDDLFSYDHNKNDLQVEPGLGQELIDYIFTRSDLTLISERRIRILQHAWDSKHQDLSDHYSLEAEVSWVGVAATETASIQGTRR